ncbi:ATP-binding protein [Sphaerothrix gracilis]|uniref:ATP-binding protein n=1 Tax=Sphaerothrix gracilis TaxID=3151835 RepID=UPI0031FC16E8
MFWRSLLLRSKSYRDWLSCGLRTQQKRLKSKYSQLSIGKKLNLSFGLLVAVTFLVVGITYGEGYRANVSIDKTQQYHFPSALASARAQSNLLSMLSNVRGYLATAESEFRNQYQASRQAFEADLEQLKNLISDPAIVQKMRNTANAGQMERLARLETLYQQWLFLPEDMFGLKDRVIENQPALKQLQSEGEIQINSTLNSTTELINLQLQQTLTSSDLTRLEAFFEFKGSFALAVAALRSYLVTRSPTFRFEYAAQNKNNQAAWAQILQLRSQLSPEQQVTLSQLEKSYTAFTQLPAQLFSIVEGDRYRNDLFLFKTQAEPLAARMLEELDKIVVAEQNALLFELEASHTNLARAQWQTLLGGGTSLALAIASALALRRAIAMPIERLTQVTANIAKGDYTVKAPITSQDEIGALAGTFNRMTRHLRHSHRALETYNRNLEQQVTERTQELQIKNDQLQTTLKELKQAQLQLIQTEKMSSLGQLVAGVAHEINNPVNFIYGNLAHMNAYTGDLLKLMSLYQQHYPEPVPAIQNEIEIIDLDFVTTDLPKVLDSMKLGAQRIQGIVASLRTFSRMDEAEVKAIDIHQGIDSTLKILESRLKAQNNRVAIGVVRRYGLLPPVECYPGQLNQVFMNILSNAIDALEERCLAETDFEPVICLVTEPTEDNQVKIMVSDNAWGMSDTVRQRLFDPFFTTKPVGKGTGMGLSISYQVVTERHGGKLICESELGQGSLFTILIPTVQVSQAVAQAAVES